MPPDLPFLVIGNIENRRVQMFCQALRHLGQPAPGLLPHADLIRDPARLLGLPDEPLLVRIDAAGENSEVEEALLCLGYEEALRAGVDAISPAALREAPLRHGEIRCPRQHHFGFLRYLRSLAAILEQRPSWRLLSPLASIAELFDKRAATKRYAGLGVPVPEALGGDLETPAELRAAARQRGWRSVFVKLTSASSASCLAVYQIEPNVVMTTIRRRPEGWFNTLRVQRVDQAPDVEEVLGFLLREGSLVERAVSKAKLGGAFFDCRVLMVAGEPAFVVARQNTHPITNLHLGGWRGDREALRELVPPAAWEAAMASCGRVAQAHACFHLGVDFLFESDLRSHRVLEANAFGDLLPGLTRDGHSVYEWEILRAREWASG